MKYYFYVYCDPSLTLGKLLAKAGDGKASREARAWFDRNKLKPDQLVWELVRLLRWRATVESFYRFAISRGFTPEDFKLATFAFDAYMRKYAEDILSIERILATPADELSWDAPWIRQVSVVCTSADDVVSDRFDRYDGANKLSYTYSSSVKFSCRIRSIDSAL